MHLHLTGVAHIEAEGRSPIPLAATDAVVLAWLAVEGPTSRARMAALLWPASSEAQARAALRQRLARLKKAVGFDPAGSAAVLQLDARLDHDLARSADLLGDLSLPDAPELDAWLHSQREQRRSRIRDELQGESARLEHAGQPDAALPVAQALLRLDPLSELAHRSVMRLHYLCGDRAAALAAFDRCEQVLKDEVGATPARETLDLLATIEAQTVATVATMRRAVPASVLRPPRMVGRTREFQQLTQAWTLGHVAAVIGEAGMGKSRLLYEFMQQHAGMVRAAGRPGDAGVPFATLARLLRAVADQRNDAASALSAETRQEIARVLPEMVDLPARQTEGQRLRLSRAISSYLAASDLAGLVVDDLHFADDASLDMLLSLADGGLGATQLRWVFAFRPAEAGSTLQSLQGGLAEAAHWVPVVLEPLDEASLASLVDDLGLSGVQGSLLAPVLVKRTGGNPLYVLETLKQAWVESGIERLAAGAALPTALSIGQLIDARIARLSRGAIALARVASIAGVDFSIALAEHALGVSAMQFADELNELEAAQVLKDGQFAHDLVFDAVLRSVPKPIARHTHARVAEWMERHQGEPARIAQHWIAAGQPAQALPWLEQAAARAEAALRNVEALAFIDLRADLEQGLGMREAAFGTRLEALLLYMQSQNEKCEASARCDALEALADRDEQRIRVWRERSASAARRTDDVEEAEAFARRALAAAQATGNSELIRSCQINLFEVFTVAERAADALPVGEACLGWIGDHADERERKNFHGALAVLYDNTGQLDKALAQFQIHRELCERTGDTADLVINMGNHAVAMSVGGRIQAAVDLQLDALRISGAIEQFDYSQGITYTNLCCDGVQIGHYAEVFRWADEAERLLAAAVPAGVPLVQAHRALVYLHLGQRARAMRLVERIAASEVAVLSARVRRHLLACRLARQQGQPAQGHVQAALALLEGQNRAALRESALIEQALDLPPDDALAALADIMVRAERGSYGGLLLEGLMRSAEIATPGQPERAREFALRALDVSQRYDLVHSYRGELWLHCARALSAAGDHAASLDAVRSGATWVHTTVREHVPAEFRDSFLHRNPVNRDLLALAAKHGIRG